MSLYTSCPECESAMPIPANASEYLCKSCRRGLLRRVWVEYDLGNYIVDTYDSLEAAESCKYKDNDLIEFIEVKKP